MLRGRQFIPGEQKPEVCTSGFGSGPFSSRLQLSLLALLPEHPDRTGDKNGRISPDDNAEHQSQREISQSAAAEEKHSRYRGQRRQRSIDGTGQALIDAGIN